MEQQRGGHMDGRLSASVSRSLLRLSSGCSADLPCIVACTDCAIARTTCSNLLDGLVGDWWINGRWRVTDESQSKNATGRQHDHTCRYNQAAGRMHRPSLGQRQIYGGDVILSFPPSFRPRPCPFSPPVVRQTSVLALYLALEVQKP